MTSELEARDLISLGPLETLVGYHLRRASSVFGSDFSIAVAGTGMRQTLFGIMSVVSANPGVNQGEVGRALGIKRANMVALIVELVEAGLVERRAADDRRAFELVLTTPGAEALHTCLKRLAEHEARLLNDMTPEDRDGLIEHLRRIGQKGDPV